MFKIFALFKRAFNWCFGTQSPEDHVIELLSHSNPHPFIRYFWTESRPFIKIGSALWVSHGGRIVVDNDMYYYIYIDGKLLEDMDLKMNYRRRRVVHNLMEDAVLSNCNGSAAYETRHYSKV